MTIKYESMADSPIDTGTIDEPDELIEDLLAKTKLTQDQTYKRAKEIEHEWLESRKAKGISIGQLTDDDFNTDFVLSISLAYEKMVDIDYEPCLVVSRVGAIETLAKLYQKPVTAFLNHRNYELEENLQELLKLKEAVVIGELCTYNGSFCAFGHLPEAYIEDAIESYPAWMHENLRANVKRMKSLRKEKGNDAETAT